MVRDPRLINIYDKPRRRRALVACRTPASSDYGTAILASVAIVLATGAFFWLYDAVAHSEDIVCSADAYRSSRAHRRVAGAA